MTHGLRSFIRDETGATAAEFAVVALIAIALTLGVIDMGRFAWEINSAKAATRAGARVAVVTSAVSEAFADYDAVSDGYFAGQDMSDPPPAGADPPQTDICTSSAGSSGGAPDSTAFNTIVAEMQGYYGRIQPENVVVEYRNVGIGVAGNPYAPDIEPLVTVRLAGNGDAPAVPLTFSPGVLQIFGMAPFLLPNMATSLSGENLGVAPS
jgi:Flp pilus assembly protein TadG